MYPIHHLKFYDLARVTPTGQHTVAALGIFIGGGVPSGVQGQSSLETLFTDFDCRFMIRIWKFRTIHLWLLTSIFHGGA